MPLRHGSPGHLPTGDYLFNVSGRRPDELERALAAAERRLAELQAWVDSSDAEAERLRARIGELEAKGSEGKVAELMQWLDASDAEAEKQRARAAEAEAVAQTALAEQQLLQTKVASQQAQGGGSGAAAELQQWLDAAEAEGEKLRARVAELEAKQGGGKQASELQQWLDAAEAEGEKLRSRVAELEAKQGGGKQAAELQQWLDASEAEAEKLRADLEAAEGKATELRHDSEREIAKLRGQLAQLEQKGARTAEDAQAWVDSAHEEAEVLRAKVVEDEKLVERDEKQVKELGQWLNAAEGENQGLRVKVAEAEKLVQRDEHQVAELQQWLDAAEAESEKLRAQLAEASPEETKRLKERVAELESSVASLTEMNRRFSDQAAAAGERDVTRLKAELERAREEGAPEKVEELGALLENAREAIATLEEERRHALAQVQRYASKDSQLANDFDRKSKGLKEDRDARIAVLQASLGQREAELKKLEARVLAYANSDTALKEELERLRMKECEAREQLAQVRGERDSLESEKSLAVEQLAQATAKLQETKEWLESAEAESEGLEKKLEAVRLEEAMREAERAAQAPKPTSAPVRVHEAVGVASGAGAAEADDTEGFSVARLRRLESMLAAETVRADTLRRFLAVAEKGLAATKDQLELALARLLDMAKKLGLKDADTTEASQRLNDAARELEALQKELAQNLAPPRPPPPPLDAFEVEVPKEEDVLSAPLDAVEALTDAQAAATRQATEALEGEHRAKEHLLTDLTWLKSQLESVSQVRDELRTRLEAMVQRELKRKAVVASLIDQLRTNEAGAAARAGTLRRLQAAIELAQRNAVKVQTIYFQKQIGSLQRQLEIALGKKRAPVNAARPAAGAQKGTVLPLPSPRRAR